MLKISPYRGNGKYWTDLAREDYYTKGGEPKGRWVGQAVDHFELSGRKVTTRQLRNVLAGFHPSFKKTPTDKLGNLAPEARASRLVQNAGKKNRQAGYDICFSAVKSVSVAWAAADPKMRQKIQRATDLAYRSGLAYLEENAAFTRRGKEGAEIEKVKLLVAAFPHCTSRAQEPNYHIHGVTANVGLREDGTTGTLASWVSEDKFGNTQTYNPLMQHMKAAGALMRSEHAYQLSKIGFPFKRSDDEFSFEIIGIPKEACEFYSTRRKEIEEHLKENGFASAEAAEFANKATRVTKDGISRPALFSKWKEELSRFGLSEEFINELAETKLAHEKSQSLSQAIETVAKTLGQTWGSFSTKELVEGVANQLVANAVPARAITDRIDKEITEGELVSLGWFHQEQILSTKENLQFEYAFLESLKRSRDNKRHTVPEYLVTQVLRDRDMTSSFTLSDEQVDAIRYLVTGIDRGEQVGGLRVLTGDAGTGKTTVMKTAREIFERAGYTVKGAALAGAAAEKLQNETQVPSYTIAKWNWEFDRRNISSPITRHGKQLAKQIGTEAKVAVNQVTARDVFRAPRREYEPQQNEWKLDSKTVIVIDETVMADSSELYQLQLAAERAGALTIFVGDNKQCQAIGHGGAFVQAERMTPSKRLTKNHRQKSDQDKEVAAHQAKGHSGLALRSLSERGRVRVEATEDKAIERLVNDWTKSGGPRDPKNHQVICATHKQRLKLNRELQWERLALLKRALGGYVTNHEEQKLYAGDRVNFRETISFIQRTNTLFGQIKTEAKYAANQVLGKEVFNPHAKPPRERITRGSFGTVVAINPLDQTIKIAMDDGRLLDVPIYKQSKPDRTLFPTPRPFRKKHKTEIALAYATTTHVSQGGSFPHIYTLAGGNMQDRELSYVQLTRGEHQTHVYTTHDLAGKELTLRAKLQDARAKGDLQSIESLEKKLSDTAKNKAHTIEQSPLARQMSRSNQKEFAIAHLLDDDTHGHSHTR